MVKSRVDALRERDSLIAQLIEAKEVQLRVYDGIVEREHKLAVELAVALNEVAITLQSQAEATGFGRVLAGDIAKLLARPEVVMLLEEGNKDGR